MEEHKNIITNRRERQIIKLNEKETRARTYIQAANAQQQSQIRDGKDTRDGLGGVCHCTGVGLGAPLAALDDRLVHSLQALLIRLEKVRCMSARRREQRADLVEGDGADVKVVQHEPGLAAPAFVDGHHPVTRDIRLKAIDAGVAGSLGDTHVVGHAANDQRVNVVVVEMAKEICLIAVLAVPKGRVCIDIHMNTLLHNYICLTDGKSINNLSTVRVLHTVRRPALGDDVVVARHEARVTLFAEGAVIRWVPVLCEHNHGEVTLTITIDGNDQRGCVRDAERAARQDKVVLHVNNDESSTPLLGQIEAAHGTEEEKHRFDGDAVVLVATIESDGKGSKLAVSQCGLLVDFLEEIVHEKAKCLARENLLSLGVVSGEDAHNTPVRHVDESAGQLVSTNDALEAIAVLRRGLQWARQVLDTKVALSLHLGLALAHNDRLVVLFLRANEATENTGATTSQVLVKKGETCKTTLDGKHVGGPGEA
eukprot:m.237377 g.237377  ORF g.237377 m.237377 type:complete len:481 (-) comp21094_c0_seq1:1822-3264(-)